MVKFPKKVKKYCPKCKKHSEMDVKQVRAAGRSSAHPLSKGSNVRIWLRGLRRGFGNYGRYSKPTKPKRTGAKQSKKVLLLYKCKTCSKSIQSCRPRAKKVEMVGVH
jgi:large subunit ribosomal protein L44e